MDAIDAQADSQAGGGDEEGQLRNRVKAEFVVRQGVCEEDTVEEVRQGPQKLNRQEEPDEGACASESHVGMSEVRT